MSDLLPRAEPVPLCSNAIPCRFAPSLADCVKDDASHSQLTAAMTKLARLTVTCLVAALPLTWIRAADTTPPVVIESAPESDVSKLQQEIAALRAENQRLTGELRDAQWALGEAKTRIDELNAPKPAPEPNAADAAAEKARADEANARLTTLVAGV